MLITFRGTPSFIITYLITLECVGAADADATRLLQPRFSIFRARGRRNKQNHWEATYFFHQLGRDPRNPCYQQNILLVYQKKSRE